MRVIVAVDFDGTLCADCYPFIGRANVRLIEQLKVLQRQGCGLILWTCRCRERLQEAVQWCRDQGLVFDAVNENLPEVIEKYGSNSRKIYADIYLDDKAATIRMAMEKNLVV